MGLFSKKTDAAASPAPQQRPVAHDPSLPGVAGYDYGSASGKKGAMPERRFNFVRPDSKRPH